MPYLFSIQNLKQHTTKASVFVRGKIRYEILKLLKINFIINLYNIQRILIEKQTIHI